MEQFQQADYEHEMAINKTSNKLNGVMNKLLDIQEQLGDAWPLKNELFPQMLRVSPSVSLRSITPYLLSRQGMVRSLKKIGNLVA
jgi:hypothetical protein